MTVKVKVPVSVPVSVPVLVTVSASVPASASDSVSVSESPSVDGMDLQASVHHLEALVAFQYGHQVFPNQCSAPSL